MRSDVLKPIFPTKHWNLNGKSKESIGIEHLAVENSKYQWNARKFCSYLATRWSLRTRSRFQVFVIKSQEVCIDWFSWHEWSAHHRSKVCNLNAWPYVVVISFKWPSSLSHHNLNIFKSHRIQCRINCIHLQFIKPLVSSIFISSSVDTKFSHLQFDLLSPGHRTCSCTWS